jgi:hypothetical protein
MNSKNIPIENTNNSEQTKSIKEQLAYRLLKKSTVILKTKKEGEKLSFFFESVNYGDNHIFISYDKSLKIKEYFIKNKIESIITKSFVKYMEFLDEFKNRINREFKNEYELKIDLEFQIIEKYNSLENFISEKNSMKDINIENETKSQLLDYFNDKNNKDILIKIFGKEKYQFFLQHFNEKILDDKLIENNGEISTDKLGKNTKPNHYGIKNQNIIFPLIITLS